MDKIDELLKGHTFNPVVDDVREKTGSMDFEQAPVAEGTKEVEKEVVAQTEVKDEVKDSVFESIESLKQETGSSDEDLASLATEIEKEVIPESPTELHLDISTLIKEKTGGKYQDLESVLLKIEQADAPKQEIFASDLIKKLNDLALSGKDIFKVLEYEKFNPESLDINVLSNSIELVKMKLKKEDPEITDREINMILKSEYGLKNDDDYVDEEEKELTQIRIKRKAKAIKEELIREKQEYTLPNVETINKAKQEQEQAISKAMDEWRNVVNDSVNSYSEESFKVTETDTFKYQIKDDARSNIRKLMTDPSGFWNRYIKSDGSRDMEKFRRDMLVIEKHEELMKSSYAQGISMGQKNVIDQLKNKKPSAKSSSASATKEKPLDMRDQILSQYK